LRRISATEGGDERKARFARLEAQQRAVQQRIGWFRAGDRLSRGELHERAAADGKIPFRDA
jgi:hypothetical protein